MVTKIVAYMHIMLIISIVTKPALHMDHGQLSPVAPQQICAQKTCFHVCTEWKISTRQKKKEIETKNG